MFKKLLFFVLLFSSTIESQNILEGEMNPVNKKYTWVVLYQLKGAKQHFVYNGKISNGKFLVVIPEGKPSGMYRLKYKLEDDDFIDFIYSKENIKLKFDPNNPTQTIQFLNSDENNLYNSYINETHFLRRKLDSIQYSFFSLKTNEEKQNSNKLFDEIRSEYNKKQVYFEEESTQQFANHLIQASNKFYPNELLPTAQEYLNSERDHYFDFVDFSNQELKNSTFYSQLILNYVFYLNESEDVEMQNVLFKNAINNIMLKLEVNSTLKSDVITMLLYSFAQSENLTIVDFLIEQYYNKQPEPLKNETDLKIILEQIKLAVGKTAPDFSWEEKEEMKSLHELHKSEIYVLAFWSTGCSHCIIDMPKLYEFTKDNKDIHVIDLALEIDNVEFDKYADKFENWTNILGLEKWQNPIARNYNIVSTPTYFVLDANKKIIAKPKSIKELKGFLEN